MQPLLCFQNQENNHHWGNKFPLNMSDFVFISHSAIVVTFHPFLCISAPFFWGGYFYSVLLYTESM